MLFGVGLFCHSFLGVGRGGGGVIGDTKPIKMIQLSFETFGYKLHSKRKSDVTSTESLGH